MTLTPNGLMPKYNLNYPMDKESLYIIFQVYKYFIIQEQNSKFKLYDKKEMCKSIKISSNHKNFIHMEILSFIIGNKI